MTSPAGRSGAFFFAADNGGRGEKFWHTSCDSYPVARKFHSPEVSPTTAQIAAINLRLAAIQLAGLRLPARAKKIQPLRRRLPVSVVSAESYPVKIRHALQNLGSAVSEIQPIQSRRA